MGWVRGRRRFCTAPGAAVAFITLSSSSDCNTYFGGMNTRRESETTHTSCPHKYVRFQWEKVTRGRK